MNSATGMGLFQAPLNLINMAKHNKQAERDARLFKSLRCMERRAKEREEAIPVAVVKQEDWRGMAFTLGGVRVLSVMDEIRELLPYPDKVATVPGSKDWMLGLANLRGVLLPIVDLQHFIGAAPVILSDQARLLVIRNQGMSTGLLVGSVQGMRHFSVDKRIPGAIFEGALGKYVYDVFGLEDGVWPVFSMAALVNDKRFMDVTA
jgi:twitching motility protein PilI